MWNRYRWNEERRCPCCYKKVCSVLGMVLNETAEGWDNYISRASAKRLAIDGTCPWCGRRTTIVSRILLSRFEPTLRAYARDGSLLDEL